MVDYLSVIENYKQYKEIADLVGEVKKLREYYYAQKYDEMTRHINYLMSKYLIETVIWNSKNHSMPTTYQESYENAEMFLKHKGYSILIEKGITDLD